LTIIERATAQLRDSEALCAWILSRAHGREKNEPLQCVIYNVCVCVCVCARAFVCVCVCVCVCRRSPLRPYKQCCCVWWRVCTATVTTHSPTSSGTHSRALLSNSLHRSVCQTRTHTHTHRHTDTHTHTRTHTHTHAHTHTHTHNSANCDFPPQIPLYNPRVKVEF